MSSIIPMYESMKQHKLPVQNVIHQNPLSPGLSFHLWETDPSECLSWIVQNPQHLKHEPILENEWLYATD